MAETVVGQDEEISWFHCCRCWRLHRKSSKLEQHISHEEAPVLDLSKDVAENMKELLNEITRKDYMSTSRRMGFLNNFSQFVRSVPLTADFGFSLDEVVACLRISLISPAKEVRAAGFRAFRHLLSDEETLNIFMKQRVDIFISKCLDLPPSAEIERVQALRLVRKIVYLCPYTFPISLAMSLSAVCCDASQDKDRMSRACLATLCELAIQNTRIAAYSGVISAIVTNVLDCSVPRMNESLVCTILYLYNHPKYRCYVRKKVGLQTILAPITDLYYTHYSDLPDNLINEDRLNRIESAKMALVAIVRSWSGLVSFCDPDENTIESVLGVFQLPNTNVRKAIIDTLFEIFCLRPPKMTDDYNEALYSVDPSAMQDSWKLTEDFLLAEGSACLQHRAQSTRANLLENYLSLVLCAFIDAGILDCPGCLKSIHPEVASNDSDVPQEKGTSQNVDVKVQSLVQVITTSDDYVCIRGSILLGELLHMANILLPPNISGQTHCLSQLMSLATNLDITPEERGKASAAVGYLDQLHQMKKRGCLPNSLFMEQLINQATSDVGQSSSKSKSKPDKVDVPSAWRDMDEVLNAIRETHVLLTQENEFYNWNWDLISTILESSKMSLKRPDEPVFYRFIKRLTLFYKPFQQFYSTVRQIDKMARKYSAVALQLTDFLLRKEEQPDGERLLIEILQDIRDCLGEATQPGILTGIFSVQSLSDTLTRDYFLIIGRLSSSTNGLRILEKTPGIFQYLMEICSMSSRDSLVKLIISCFDYGRDGIARVLLSKALSSAPESSRLYATRFLRILLRVKSPYFSNWGIEFLTNQLYDQDSEVVEASIDILEEACEDEANLQRLIEIKPALLHLGEHGIRLLSRYVSVSKGFSYLQEMQYLEPLLDVWKNTYSREYVNWIELELAESFSLYERHGTDGGYIRRSGSKFVQRRDVYILPHLYGELARHRNGIELIKTQNLLDDASTIVKQQFMETPHDIFQMKAALWAVGHMTSTSLGINLIPRTKRPSQLSVPSGSFTEPVISESLDQDDVMEDEEDDPDIMEIIVDMAVNCEVLTLRGTAFYVLGLMASTSTGADHLEEYGWESVRHKGTDIWPVIEQDVAIIYEPDWSDEEQVSEVLDDTDFPPAEQQQSQAQERFGGIYLGEDVNEDDDSNYLLSFDYSVQRYGDDKKKKKGKVPTSDETRYLQMISSASGDDSFDQKNMKMTFYDVDSYGFKYEKQDTLLNGLERMNAYGNIHFGDEESASVPFSEYKPPEYGVDPSFREHVTFEDFMPFLSGKNPDAPKQDEEVARKNSQVVKTKEIFDKAGIYLGEEEVEDEHVHDTIEANITEIASSPPQEEATAASPVDTTSVRQDNTTRPLETSNRTDSLQPSSRADVSRTLSSDKNSPLKPIREEKSQESLNSKTDLIDISVEEEITVELQNKRKYSNCDSNDTSTLNSSILSEDRTPTRSPLVHIEPARYRSVSLDDPPKTEIERSPRSSSFSGTAAHNKLTALSHPRSDSDPGFGPTLMGSSVSSQESDIMRENGRRNLKHVSRKKSNSETESERNRSSSILSDSSSVGVRLRLAKRLRGSSTLSLGISPKSSRGISSATPSESPYSSSYSREGAYGYTAWQTLKKQRSFKKELDSTLRKHSGAISEKRRSHRSLAYQYRRLLDISNRRTGGHSPGTAYIYPRRHISSTSSGGAMELPGEVFSSFSGSGTEVYVGRCLPSMQILPHFFSEKDTSQDVDVKNQVKTYDYVGSWADNFVEFSEEYNLRTFQENYVHVKERCLACRIRLQKEEGKPRSESDVSLPSKSRSNSKDETVTDEDSESSGRDETSSKQKINVFKEVLRLVISLSSAVASKGTQQEILALRTRFPWAFQDLCLYSQVMEQLGMFTFRLTMRRFIQALFEGVNYALIFEAADTILGRPTATQNNTSVNNSSKLTS